MRFTIAVIIFVFSSLLSSNLPFYPVSLVREHVVLTQIISVQSKSGFEGITLVEHNDISTFFFSIIVACLLHKPEMNLLSGVVQYVIVDIIQESLTLALFIAICRK